MENFFRYYRPLADTWRLYDSSGAGGPRLIASGEGDSASSVRDRSLWRALTRRYGVEGP